MQQVSAPTDQDFRAAGYTAAARDYPLSKRACRWIAAWNNVPFERLPPAWRYAPNAGIFVYIERRAAAEESSQ